MELRKGNIIYVSEHGYNKEVNFMGQQLKDYRDEYIDERFNRIDDKIDTVSNGINDLKNSINRLDEKFERKFERIDDKFDEINKRFEVNKNWQIGLLASTIVGFISVIITIIMGT